MKVGLIGIGNWGKNHLRTFMAIPDVSLAWVCDTDGTRLSAAKRQYPTISVTHDAARLIAEVDAVVVATPATTHFSLARQTLLAGKAVLVEKPLALRREHGEELVELAEARGQVLMVGHLLLFHPGVVQLRDILRSGRIGHTLYMYSQRLNLGVVRSDENVLWSLAPHDISVFLHLTDTLPEAVSATGHAYLQSGIEDIVFGTLLFPRRTLAHFHVSWLDPHKTRQFTVVGTEGMVALDDMLIDETLKIFAKAVSLRDAGHTHDGAPPLAVRYGGIFSPVVPPTEPLLHECRHFVECVRTGSTPVTDGRNGLATLYVLEAAQRSLEQGGVPVEIRANATDLNLAVARPIT